MIQRIQTVYWLLVAGLMLVMLFAAFPVNILSPFEEICIVGLSVVAICLYKRRKWQTWCGYLMFFLLLLDCILFLTSYFQKGIDFSTLGADIKNFGITLGITIIALIFNLLAILNVKKDEKLVRSLDRLR